MLGWTLLWVGCSPIAVLGSFTGDTASESAAVEADCEPGARNGSVTGSDNRQTQGGTRFVVRVPDAYDPTVAHPLVVVYAPAGGDPEITEAFTGLTPDLLDAGYLVAYADHRSPASEAVLEDLGTIPRRIARSWCIDEERIHFTGHSDGGSIATVLAVRPDLGTIRPASIAPSAAGTGGSWFEGQACPEPLPVLVAHSSRDALFPGFGEEAAAWWGDCGGCGPNPRAADQNGCQEYRNCAGGIEVSYCEHGGSHGTWPDLNRSIVRFFDRTGLPPAQ